MNIKSLTEVPAIKYGKQLTQLESMPMESLEITELTENISQETEPKSNDIASDK